MLEIYKCGTKVFLNNDIEGIIVACLMSNTIEYKIAYWKENERKVEWFTRFEVEDHEESAKQLILV